MENTRFIALDASATHAGAEFQGRTYPSAAYAQIANPLGRVYVATLLAAADYSKPPETCRERVKVEAQVEYPLTLQSTRVAGLGAQAEGAWVLRDLGPKRDNRWAVQFRNDQNGGHCNSDYFADYAEANAAYARQVADTLASNSSKAAYYAAFPA